MDIVGDVKGFFEGDFEKTQRDMVWDIKKIISKSQKFSEKSLTLVDPKFVLSSLLERCREF